MSNLDCRHTTPGTSYCNKDWFVCKCSGSVRVADVSWWPNISGLLYLHCSRHFVFWPSLHREALPCLPNNDIYESKCKILGHLLKRDKRLNPGLSRPFRDGWQLCSLPSSSCLSALLWISIEALKLRGSKYEV